MVYLAIVKVSAGNRIEKYQEFPTLARAQAHVSNVIGTYPDAYAVQHPGGSIRDLLCDKVAETVSISALPGPTAEEITAAKTAKAASGLNTPQNKTIHDALWELHRAIRGVIALPTETKAEYADRLKTMWVGNEP